MSHTPEAPASQPVRAGADLPDSPTAHTLTPGLRVAAVMLLVLAVPGSVVGAWCWMEAVGNDEPLAALGLVFAVVLWLWTLVPALAGGTALLLGSRHPRAAQVLVVAALVWFALFALPSVWFFGV